MRRKITLCILGLVLLGMLCVPVAGNWQFCIIDEVKGLDHTSINGIYNDPHPSGHRWIIDIVNVSDDLDSVTVKIKVALGPTTTLNITRSYIQGLEQTGSRTPALFAWGGTLTYDVYGGYINGETIDMDPTTTGDIHATQYSFHVTDHLKLRGKVHDNIGDWVLPEALSYNSRHGRILREILIEQ